MRIRNITNISGMDKIKITIIFFKEYSLIFLLEMIEMQNKNNVNARNGKNTITAIIGTGCKDPICRSENPTKSQITRIR